MPREAALDCLRTLLAIDAYMADSENPRLSWVTVALTFDLTSIRGLSLTEIASQLGVGCDGQPING